MRYAELQAASNFTFLTGASHAEELVERAATLGLGAIAITDKNTFGGIVRAHTAAERFGVRLVIGVKLVLRNGAELLAYPKNKQAYARLCRLLTVGKRRAEKGACDLTLKDVLQFGDGVIFVIADGTDPHSVGPELIKAFDGRVFVGMAPRYDGQDRNRFAMRAMAAEALGAPLVAMGDAIMHESARIRVADILSCIREQTTIDRLGRLAQSNAERRIKSEFEMRRMFRDHSAAIKNTWVIAEQCRFSLNELKYEYPNEDHDGLLPDDRLRKLTEQGLEKRYPDGPPLKIRAMVEKELRLIAELDFAKYFLTVYEIVAFARSQGILCQGRGSAANSVVCYCLGVTEASPETITMVVERFISEARNEPPDIDIDFEHGDQRERVIQHIFEKYGRERAAICSTVVHFRTRKAVREVGKAMGLSDDCVSALASQVWGTSSAGLGDERAKAAGLSINDHRVRLTLELSKEIIGFPRHLSQHVGGFVITDGRLDELCPIENAAMPDRTIIEWDKNDIEALGILKIDVLALGMLSCIRKSFDLLRVWKGQDLTLATLPKEDPSVYDMLCIADTVGVFQIESRAQMNFLPRMRPRNYRDLVAEVAIIRPGPIQGDMVHPFIRRRRGEEEVTYPSEDLKGVLERTYGVPLYQEQAMQIAVVAAGFTPTEADALRRALGGFNRLGRIEDFKSRFIHGCLERGYDPKFAENCFKQLEGFSSYGFPESHAASFALLVYASAWLKKHHPEVFCCAILNAQPMGFYAPAQLIKDAREHGVKILPICIQNSFWDNVLEPAGDGSFAVRLGFRQIKGLPEDDGLWIAAARGPGYRSIDDVWRRAGLGRGLLARLAAANAFGAFGLKRREAFWSVKGVSGDKPLPLFEELGENLREATVDLPPLTVKEEVFNDYLATRFSLGEHPVSLLRGEIGPFLKAAALRDTPDGHWVTVSGLVITRQRPGTASGVIFITLEDATGVSNLIIWPKTFARYRKTVMAGRLIKVHGKLQREGIVTHVIATRIEDCSSLLDHMGDAQGGAYQIDPSYDNPDEAKRAVAENRYALKREPRHPPAEEITTALQRAQLASFGAGARHPREQAKKLFYSRDYR